MSSKYGEKIIDKASPHTVKKFELLEGYIESWKEIMLLQSACEELIFIDCMSSSGEYIDIDGKTVYGTPVRADKLLREAASRYTRKNIRVIFNDKSAEKIDHLKTLIPESSGNYHVSFYNEDCNILLRNLQDKICGANGTHYLLFYDPYQAVIDWDALMPYFNHWGEVIINHMLSDSIRAVREAKSPEAVSKYESTYRGREIMELSEWGSDKKKYESCVESIIRSLRMRKSRDYFIASFPFFNVNNALLYDIIHCTGHIKGFKLFKKTAWQIFGGQSSNKRPLKSEAGQGVFVFPDDNNESSDEYCYTVDDIAHYIHGKFTGLKNVPLSEIWDLLNFHPVFPSEGFKNDIKQRLKEIYGDKVSGKAISFEA